MRGDQTIPVEFRNDIERLTSLIRTLNINCSLSSTQEDAANETKMNSIDLTRDNNYDSSSSDSEGRFNYLDTRLWDI